MLFKEIKNFPVQERWEHACSQAYMPMWKVKRQWTGRQGEAFYKASAVNRAIIVNWGE